MRHRKSRRFRHRSNGRNFQSRDNGAIKPNGFLNDRIRGNYKSIQNPEKLVEKYNALAKEALSSGDKISSENLTEPVFSEITDLTNLILFLLATFLPVLSLNDCFFAIIN